MKKILFLLCAFATSAAFASTKASSVTHNFITWTFDRDYEIGQFVNGDWWVIGPVKIIAIDNSLSDKKFLPTDGTAVSGSMINPIIDKSGGPRSQFHQGYDERIQDYVEELNAALPNGKPLSKDNPLEIKPISSLMSTVSWLWNSDEDKEAGCPKVPPTPWPSPSWHLRPTLRAAAVLTVLTEAPKEGTFRPAYAGTEKRFFNLNQIKRDRLLNLPPPESINAVAPPEDVTVERALYACHNQGSLKGDHSDKTTNIHLLVKATSQVWLDHIPQWFGGQAFHPSINIPNYGREICHILQSGMLALHVDWNKIDGAPKTKDPLIINMVQIGIDMAGIADAGGYWPADGGHHAGRKPAILFAGLLLDDKHMMNVGNWETRFQDNEYTFYLTEEHVEYAQSDRFRPDTRGLHVAPYTKEMIGMPEWAGNQAGWNLAYRDINNSFINGFALTFLMMDARKLFNHEPYFDYADRAQGRVEQDTRHLQANRAPRFAQDMWDTFREKYPSTYDKKWESDALFEIFTTTKEEWEEQKKAKESSQ